MSYVDILYRVESGVATITLNRPEKLNAISFGMYDEMRAAMAAADGDEAVRVIVLTGAGRGFCAGADNSRLADIVNSGGDLGATPGAAANPMERPGFPDRYAFQRHITKPVIAAVNGHAVGVGFILALFCDIRIACDEAMLSTGFSRLGLVGEFGVAWRLERLVGHGRAADLLLRSPRVSGREALTMGMVEFSVPTEDFPEFVRKYSLELATEVSPRSLRVLKQQLWQVPAQTLEQHLAESSAEAAKSWGSEDFREGVAHRREKRPPRFTGR